MMRSRRQAVPSLRRGMLFSASVVLAAMFCGALIISALPFLATWLPSLR